MLDRFCLALVSIALAAAVPAAAEAADCAPVLPLGSVSELPKAWRAAIDELKMATARTGKPWSCVGGTVELDVHGADGGATLTVRTADGATIVREVESAEDVAPLGMAMLSRPEPRDPSPGIAPPPPGEAPGPPAKSPAPPGTPKVDSAARSIAPDAPVEERVDPRVIVSAMVAPRYAGKSNVLMGSAEVGVGVPIASWVPGLWIRFDGPVAGERRDKEFVEACVGGAFGRAFAAGPVDLTPSVTGSAAIMVEDRPKKEPSETHVDVRVGANLRVALPRKSLIRAAFAADFEIAPNQFDDHRKRGDQEPIDEVRLPSYTLGLGVGVELAPR